ncbi:UDP-Glycosyltransferase/glycogen phosphorylase [Thozetella sp. PMI_491]|nr:UDP-Glycosyltransferase/glycogen phosphorylase [Thozetella sp. PMI_491]
MSSFSLTGHFLPAQQVAAYLVQRGYTVYFVAAPAFEASLAATEPRIQFIPIMGPAGMLPDAAEHPVFLGKMTGFESLVEIMMGWSICMPSSLDSLRRAMVQIRKEHPKRELVIVTEAATAGIPPLKLGAPLPEGYTTVPKSLGFNIVPPIWTSLDQGPPLLGLPYDVTHSEAPAFDQMRLALQMCGVGEDALARVFGDHREVIEHSPLETMFTCHDTVLQMCIPSLEFPVSDWPSHVRFGGTLPPKPLPADFQFPRCSTRKKIVAVAQGTLAVDWSALLVPTIRSLANRHDLIVVAILGVRGASLDIEVPSNTLVVDYFPYDAVIMHTDVFVTNGSYGVFSHCVAHGVPMVLAGHSEDKPDMGMRGEWAGLAVNLRTGNPSPDMISAGVERVLRDSKYKDRASELMKEAHAYGALENLEREVRKLF